MVNSKAQLQYDPATCLLRFSLDVLLSIPEVCILGIRRGAFSVYHPRLWNSLPSFYHGLLLGCQKLPFIEKNGFSVSALNCFTLLKLLDEIVLITIFDFTFYFVFTFSPLLFLSIFFVSLLFDLTCLC